MEDAAAVLNEILPEGWSPFDADDPFAGFICPHGHAIEADGECPEGCRSPLVELGII